MKKSTTIFDFFKRKYSNSSEVNVGLPTTNVAIPIPKNVDVPILENSIPQFQKRSMFQSQEIFILQFQKMPISQFQKITISLKHNFKKLILILWIMIPEHANKYGNIMLINVMKFNGFTLKMVRTNLV